MPRTLRDWRRRREGQLRLPGFEDVAIPEPEPPEPEPVDPPPPLVITSELQMTVKGWSLPAGWVLQRGETVESALAAFLAMESRGSKTK